MKKFSLNSSSLFILALLLASATAITQNFQKSASAANVRPSFQTGYAFTNTSISVILNPMNAGSSYDILLWRPSQSYPSSAPFQTGGPYNGPTTFNSSLLDTTGNWRVEVLTTGSAFLFNIQILSNNNTVGPYAGIASTGRIFTLYYGAQASYTVTAGLSSGDIGDLNFAIYGPFSALSYVGGTPLPITPIDGQNLQVNYQTRGNQYYYVTIDPTDALYMAGPLIRLMFQTDMYQCPYTIGVTDYNGCFVGCSTNAPTQGFPCIQFNYVVNLCQTCQSPWVADSRGICIQQTNCGPNQYYSYGQCYQVMANCNSFQQFGGRCLSCSTGFQLNNYNNGSQACTPVIPTCGANQYLLGTVCMNNVANCGNFITSTGVCQVCVNGYNLQGNTCVRVQTQSVSCPLGQQAVNGICQIIDPNCIFYSTSNQCLICSRGWQTNQANPNGLCKQIICASNQYSGNGYCQDSSPLCGTFDPIYGNCLTCIYGYLLQSDGSCLQSYGSSAAPTTPADCNPGYYLQGNSCVPVSPLCRTYNQTTGACTTCINNQFYLLDGICNNISTFCANTPRTYFNNGNCVSVNKYCDTFDLTNGNCYSCLDNAQLDPSTGRCLFSQTCGQRQYPDQNGLCRNASVNCSTFDPSNGQCLTCINGFELNTGGVCCYQLNYLDDATRCAAFLSQNCASANKQFSYCITCATGFSKPQNSYFAKCQNLNDIPN